MSIHRVVLVSAVAVLLALSSLSGAVAKQKCHSPKCEAASVWSPFASVVAFFKDPTAGLRKTANGIVEHATQEAGKVVTKAETAGYHVVERAKQEAQEFSDAVEAKVNHALIQFAIWLSVGLFVVVITILALVALIVRLIVKRRDGGPQLPPSAEVIVLDRTDRTKKLPSGKPPQKRLAKAA